MALLQGFLIHSCKIQEIAWRYRVSYYYNINLSVFTPMDASKPALWFDMDGTTFDFQTPLMELMKNTPTLPKKFIEIIENTNNWKKIALWDLWDWSDDERKEIQNIIEPLYQNIEFFKWLKPYPWIVDLIHSLEEDFDIYFCTKPSKKDCWSESVKRTSIITYFGEKYSQRVLMQHDKTMATLDILVDDNPHIHWRNKKNGRKPTWIQFLVDQPHNQDSDLPRLYLDRLDLWKWQLLKIV